MKKMIPLSIILTGSTAMASQIIYMRDLLVVFYGNELSISFILAGWLISGALGSAIFGRLADRIKSDIKTFSLCQIILACLLMAGIVAIKFIKLFLGINPGEIVGIFPIVAASFAILAPICILMGFMFSLGCRIYTAERNEGARGIGAVYILEALGSIIGGAITSFILIGLFGTLDIAAIFALLNILASFLLALSMRKNSFKPIFILIAIIAIWAFGGFKMIERCSLQKQWQGYEVLDTKNSIYGNILIARRGEDYSLFNNGLRFYTIPDKPGSEEAVHLALLEHRNPKRVLLIGGGVGGLIEEILKHHIEKVDYVELDPSIIKISERNLPESYYGALKERRVSIKNADGRFFIKNTGEKYDCIIVHTGDPYTAENNRYYTAEFFNEAKRALKEGGLISFGLTSSESYIGRSLAEFLKSIYATLKSVFREVFIIPGETAYFLASDSAGLTYDHKILEERTLDRALDTQYVRDYYLFSKLSPEKIDYSEKIIKNEDGAVINHDSRPIAYYYGLIFWTTLFRDSAFSNILRSVTGTVIWRSIGIFMILLATISVIYRRSFKRATLIAVMMGGFSSMAFQLLILLTFQTMYGYLFYKLGIILTSFMAGLALGAIFVIKFIPARMHENQYQAGGPARMHENQYQAGGPETKDDKIFLMAVQGDFILFSILLGVLFSKFCPDFLFPILSVIAGSIGGAQFAIANKVLLGQKNRDIGLPDCMRTNIRQAGLPDCMRTNIRQAGKVGGLSYGIDLLGSFFGALLTGIFLIPILGIPKTSFAVALVNLSILIMLLINVSVEE